MSEHSVATQAQRLVDRMELLEREKDHRSWPTTSTALCRTSTPSSSATAPTRTSGMSTNRRRSARD
jgi:hypothetical protein